MLTNCDEWCRIECGECKWFTSSADIDYKGAESRCKRLDHKHLRFAKKIFSGYDCGYWDTNTCSDFEPHKGALWLYENWDKVKAQIIPYSDRQVILLNVDGNTDVRYAIKATEFYNNTFRNEDGSLRWLYKYYTVPRKRTGRNANGLTYGILYETPDGLASTWEVICAVVYGGLAMELETLKKLIGYDKFGGEIKDMMLYFNIYDLTKITEEMAQEWLRVRKDDKNE